MFECIRGMPEGNGWGVKEGIRGVGFSYASPLVGGETLNQSGNLPEPRLPHQKYGRNYNLYLAGVLRDPLCESAGYTAKHL